MPAKDIYHDMVKNALIKDGWTITDDPYRLVWGTTRFFVDLGAEQLLAAEKESRKIAVEIKSFVGHSNMADLEQALGQYILYDTIMSEKEQERVLYLAVSKQTVREVFDEPVGRLLIDKQSLKLIVFEPKEEVIVRWIQ
jgi:hypothetical protein